MSKKKRASERMQASGDPTKSSSDLKPVVSAKEAPKDAPKDALRETKDPATQSASSLASLKGSSKVKLNYVDPGAERHLPQPPRISIRPGDRVKLKKTQDYADASVPAGEEGFALNPSSQAACWCVSFFKDGKLRVVPEWLLESVGPRAAAH